MAKINLNKSNSILKAVLVDDQEICTEMLKEMLEKDSPEVAVSAICNSGKEGLKAINKYQPDIVVLDVEMPNMSGFEMLQKIKDPTIFSFDFKNKVV